MDLVWTLADPFVDVSSRTFWPVLLVSSLIAWMLTGTGRWRRLVSILRHPSTALDAQLLVGRQLLRAVGLLPTLLGTAALAVSVARTLSHTFGAAPLAGSVPAWLVATTYGVVFFVAWDFSRFLLHWAMHRSGVLWAFHQVHHSAEVLTPLTIHRVHPVETLLYGLRGALVTGTLAGVFFWLFGESTPAAALVGITTTGVVLNAVFGNLRHSHIWIRFGAFEKWFISPAQHQLHHADVPETYDTNFGVWFALWDRLFGTWQPSPASPPPTFGVSDGRNHNHDLISAWLGPLRDVGQHGWRWLQRTVDPVALGKSTVQDVMGPILLRDRRASRDVGHPGH